MKVFFCDLDNTLVYSHRREIVGNRHCVEIYQDREITFMTEQTDRLLRELMKVVCLIPLTTRTTEQYQRILLPVFPKYALTCNGGVLLRDGVEDDAWYQETLRMIANCQEQLTYSMELLALDRHICLEIQNIRQLFIYTKSEKPKDTVRFLEEHLDTTNVSIYNHRNKIYVVPKVLSKGMAVRRLCEKICSEQKEVLECVLAAGDTIFDVSMLKEADLAFAPRELSETVSLPAHVVVMDEKPMFSEQILTYILKNSDGFVSSQLRK